MSNIDPQISQQIVQLLSTYGTPAGIAAAQAVGTGAVQALGSGAAKAVKSLWGKIRHKSEQEGGIVEVAVTAFEAAPQDTEHQQALSFVLKQLCSADSAFAHEITQLFKEAQRDPVAEQFIQNISGNAQVGIAGANYGSVTIHQTTHQGGINKEDFAKFGEEIDRKHQARILFLKAENATSLVECERFIREALQKYPDLPGALSFLGLRVSNAVIEHFTYQLLMDTLVQPERLGTSVIPMFYAEFALMNPTPPKLEAIHWLEKALQHQDDPEGEVTAALALMYGYSDAYDLMLDTIQKARTLSLSLISCFQRPVHLMMLIYACHSLASVEEAMRNVSLQLPKFDEVQQALREASNPKNNPSNIIQLYVEWFGVELTTEGISRTPVKVRIYFPHKEKLTTYGEIFRRSQPSTIIPPQPTTTGIIETFIPIDDILKQLTALGVVLITRI